MKLVICDDKREMAVNLQEKAGTILQGMNVEADIQVYSSGKTLIEDIRDAKVHADILLLDIDMPEMNGMEVAEKLRAENSDIILIFVSSFEDMVYETFKFQAFRFIRKWRIEEELWLALKDANREYRRQIEEQIRKERYVILETETGEHRVRVDDIWYFETEGRRLRVHLENETILTKRRSLEDLLHVICDENFVKIHSGCVVNLKYIQGYGEDIITMDNGEELRPSRIGIRTVRKELARYWR